MQVIPKSITRNKPYRSLAISKGDLLNGVATQDLSVFRQ
jgi:hypothetical protein